MEKLSGKYQYITIMKNLNPVAEDYRYSYEIYEGESCKTVERSTELFDTRIQAELAATGHISLLEKGEST